MIAGGNATVMVADLDRAVAFYTRVLGLELLTRSGSDWAEVTTGGLTIGLHLAGHGAKPGTPGSISIGLVVDQPIEQVMATLRQRGVRFHGPVVEGGAVKLAFFADPDGSALYLCEVDHAG
jgi:catechol 2,3-dioxygenase-like lactoylglutathione lyase family enzyme